MNHEQFLRWLTSMSAPIAAEVERKMQTIMRTNVSVEAQPGVAQAISPQYVQPTLPGMVHSTGPNYGAIASGGGGGGFYGTNSQTTQPIHITPTWRNAIESLNNSGFDTRNFEREIERRLAAVFTKLAGELLDEFGIDPIEQYHFDAQRHALVEILTQVAILAIQMEGEQDVHLKTKPIDPRLIDLSGVLTNERLQALFTGEES